MLGLSVSSLDDEACEQGQIGYSRMDRIDAWEQDSSTSSGGLEHYPPCLSSVCAPPIYTGLDPSDPQWQREPSSHLKLDFVYGYQGASCWEWDLYGIGPGLNNLNFVNHFDSHSSAMAASGEIIYTIAATCVVFDSSNNVQRFFYHSDDVTAMALLIRMQQAMDGSWAELNKPPTLLIKSEWEKFAAYNKGVHTPSERAWSAKERTLPVHSDEWPCMQDGQIYDWRTWELPSRCIVASGQKGRNPRIFVWRIISSRGDKSMNKQILAKMSIGMKRLQVGALSFNAKGNFLLALSMNFEHSLTVFDWRKETKTHEGLGAQGSIESIRFNPYSASSFATCGTKHLKFWELGETDLECAVGLFGDLGEPVDMFCLTFNSRGVTFSGNEKGEIYVWSNGTVTAKYASAHKGKVLGLLYVEKVALFSVGIGGDLCMWDPELKDLVNPIGKVDLRSLCHSKGETSLLQRLSGRSMEYTEDPTIISSYEDSHPVDDNPARGVCGSPATHLSFHCLGTKGVLLVGTTCNTIMALGIRAVGDWVKGLSGEHMLKGYSKSSVEGPLKSQTWWENENVQKCLGKYGSLKGNLPVAVYAYQSHNPSAAGYRAKNATCPWKLAVCGKTIIMKGHFGSCDAVMPAPHERLFVSVSKDMTAALWDINDQTMIDNFYTHYPTRSVNWWCDTKHVDGPVAEEIIKGTKMPILALGHENGNFSIWRLEKSAASAAKQDADDDIDPFYDPHDAFGQIKLCCINPLPRPLAPCGKGRVPSEQVLALRYSGDGKYLAVCIGDNCVDIYRHSIGFNMDRPSAVCMRESAKQKALGLSDEELAVQDCLPYKRVGCFNDHSSSVLAVDFSDDGSVFRSISASNELLYSSMPHGKLNSSTVDCNAKKWCSHTCKFGWTVKSIWARGSTASDINGLDVSKTKMPPWAPAFGGKNPAPYPMPRGYKASGHNDPVDRLRLRNFPGEGSATTKGHQVCVTGQDDGRVKLFRFPAFGFKQAFRSYIGHGSSVHDVRFTYDDDYVLSAGGPDMSIFQVDTQKACASPAILALAASDIVCDRDSGATSFRTRSTFRIFQMPATPTAHIRSAIGSSAPFLRSTSPNSSK
jgi:WD40 repeat protein